VREADFDKVAGVLSRPPYIGGREEPDLQPSLAAGLDTPKPSRSSTIRQYLRQVLDVSGAMSIAGEGQAVCDSGGFNIDRDLLCR